MTNDSHAFYSSQFALDSSCFQSSSKCDKNDAYAKY